MTPPTTFEKSAPSPNAKEYLVVPLVDAQQVREAIGRIYAASLGRAWPITAEGTDPAEHVADTLYYIDPLPSADSSAVAFGPRDEVIDACLGQTVTTTDGVYVLPAECQALARDWFLDPPREDPPHEDMPARTPKP